jgi:hypothetical protein
MFGERWVEPPLEGEKRDVIVEQFLVGYALKKI